MNALTQVFIVLGILAAINFMGFRHYKRFDFTEKKQFSLAPQSIKVVKALDDEVRITGFFKGQEKALFDDLLDKYTYHSKKIVSRFVDVDKEIAIAKQYGVRKYGTVIIEKGKRETRVDGIADPKAEEKLTNAIIKVGREKVFRIYFTKGHAEKSVGDQDREGLSVVKEELENRGYEVKELLLLETGRIPSDGDVLVIAGPEKSFLQQETSLIAAYLKAGGRGLLMLDPQERPVGLEPFLQEIGIQAQRDRVIDPISTLFGQGAATPVVSQYTSHTIVRDLDMASFYPLARSLSIAEKQPQKNIHVEALAVTSANAWGEKDSLKSNKVKFDKDKDLKGPLNLAVAAEGSWGESSQKDEKKKMRLVVFGDSDFANNRSFGFSGNGNLFLNAVAWLVEDETAISILPIAAGVGRFVMTPIEMRMVFILTVVVVPLLIIGSGITVWWRRRKLA